MFNKSIYKILHKNKKRVPANTNYHPIDVMGAAITMLPSEYISRRLDKPQTLFSQNNRMLQRSGTKQQLRRRNSRYTNNRNDDGEAIRVIIPEAIISVPQGVSHTFLLAETPYLMQGHKYISDLYQPQLHFSDQTVYTMSVQRAHKIVKLLPISATTQTPHRTILLHSRHPYDPPTYINNAIFTKTHNRPDTSVKDKKERDLKRVLLPLDR
jgi:hypothetical protein